MKELEALRALAESCGLEQAYRDGLGVRREAAPESVLAVLRALGVPVERPADAGEALRARRADRAARRLEPVTVCWEGSPPAVRLRRAPGGAAPAVAELRTEAGERREIRLEAGSPGAASLPRDLALGYHRLRLVEGDGEGEGALVIRAPRTVRRLEPARRWGLFLPLYALRSERDWGLGDYTGLRDLAAWTAARGGRLVGTVPFLAGFHDRPFDPSPYAPASRLFWSETHADPERAPGWDAAVLDALPPGADRLEALRRELREAPEVDYRRVAALKRELFDRLARRFLLSHGDGDADFADFVERTPFVRDYARFRAAVELRGTGWRSWPERMRDGELRPGDYLADAVARHLFVQWVADRQVEEASRVGEDRGAGLYLDLPLGAHPEGFDTWRFRDHFAFGVASGAPPDDFFREGQAWGLPPLHPERIREGGYAYTRACLRHGLRRARALRIDHVMGLHRLFWVPDGAPATEGVYVRYREEEMWAVLCLESERHGTEIVGEDLGTVPDEVRERMRAHDVDRMYVVPFEARPDPERPLPPVPRRSLATLGTHDTYPFGSFWSGADVSDRRRRGLLDAEAAEEESARRSRLRAALAAWLGRRGLLEGPPTGEKALRGLLAHLAAGPARTLMVGLEDLWLESRPQNVPGTPAEENWRRKARYPLERLAGLAGVERVLGEVDRLRLRGRDGGTGR